MKLYSKTAVTNKKHPEYSTPKFNRQNNPLAKLACWRFLSDSGVLVQSEVRGMKIHVFPNNELPPPTAVLTAQQSTVGQNPFSSLGAIVSHLGRPFRLQLSKCSTAHLSFGGCFYPKCPVDPQVFLAWAPLGKRNLSHLPLLWLAKISPNVINAIWMMHSEVSTVKVCDIFP